MTIDEAIKTYTSNAEYERTHGNLQGCLDFRQLAEWLKELKELREQTKWIPCSERLPEDCTEVFVYLFDNSRPHIVWIEDTHWYTEDFEIERENEPVAWMPLPEPYQGGESDADSD